MLEYNYESGSRLDDAINKVGNIRTSIGPGKAIIRVNSVNFVSRVRKGKLVLVKFFR